MERLIQRLSYALCILLSIHTSWGTEPNNDGEESLSSLTFLVPESLINATEDQAKLWCREDFGLSDTEILGSWKRTYALHNALWRYHRNNKAIEMLVELGFPLAIIYHSSDRDDYYFNNAQSLLTKLLSPTYEFLNDLSIVEVIKLIRDIVMVNMTQGAEFRVTGLVLESMREEFYQIPGINEGGRAVTPLDTAGSSLLNSAELLLTISNKLIKACYQNIFSRNNTSYILFLFDLPFTLCLSERDRLALYEQAQDKYRTQLGCFHPGIFQHSFPIAIFETSSPPNDLNSSPATPNLDYDVYETLGSSVDEQEFEQTCLRLFHSGDSIWALTLGNFYNAQNWSNRSTPEFDPAFSKAKQWFTTALTYPATKHVAQKKLDSLEELPFYKSANDRDSQV